MTLGLPTTLLLACVMLLAPGGCAASSGVEPLFGGTRHPQMVAAEGVREVAELPPDHVDIGTIDLECRYRSDDDRKSLVVPEVECDEWALRRKVVRRASEVGGTVLVGHACERQTHKDARPRADSRHTRENGPATETTVVLCRARVGRPRWATSH